MIVQGEVKVGFWILVTRDEFGLRASVHGSEAEAKEKYIELLEDGQIIYEYRIVEDYWDPEGALDHVRRETEE